MQAALADQELSRTAGAERVLVVDLAASMPDLTGLDGARHLSSEAGGLRQRLAFDAEQTGGSTPRRADLRLGRCICDGCGVLPDVEVWFACGAGRADAVPL